MVTGKGLPPGVTPMHPHAASQVLGMNRGVSPAEQMRNTPVGSLGGQLQAAPARVPGTLTRLDALHTAA